VNGRTRTKTFTLEAASVLCRLMADGVLGADDTRDVHVGVEERDVGSEDGIISSVSVVLCISFFLFLQQKIVLSPIRNVALPLSAPAFCDELT
jgi:hypothetical protein